MRRILRIVAAVLAALVFAVTLSAAGSARAGAGRTFDLPGWSPDGREIAWGSEPFGVSGGSEAAQIWIANTDGSGAKRLIGGLRDGLFEIVWPRPNVLLYDANFQVFQADPGGSHRVVLPDTGSTFTTDADGDRVAASCDRCNGPIEIASVTTGKRLNVGAKGTSNGGASFSPDGSQIAFNHADDDQTTGRYSNGGLWVAKANGTDMRRLVTNASCASWSPNGQQIAYLTPGNRGLRLSTIAPNGNHNRLLLSRGPSCSVPPSFAWSPNSKTIAYAQAGWGRLVLLNMATGRTTTINRFKSVTGIAWSPDSTELLVTARANANSCASLWTINANGASRHRIASCR